MYERRGKSGKVTRYIKFKDQHGNWVDEITDCRTKREALALEAQRKREVADGTYRRGATATSALTLEGYASKEWLPARKNKTKTDDAQRLRDYVFPALGSRRLRDMRAAECIDFVRGLVARGINPKTVSNIWGTLRTLLRDAYISELIGFSPIMPRGIIPSRQSDITEIYSDADVLTLCGCATEEVGMDLFALLGFYTGAREGEICGLRVGDWTDNPDRRGLGVLAVRRQYDGSGDDATLKTNRVRLVPVHPLLAEELRRRLAGRAKGEPIVPLRPGEHHTKSTAYKSFVRHCEALAVPSFGLHRMRHTAITVAQRGGAPKHVVERFTHNSRGDIVDRYTHDWTILSAAVSAISYGVREESREVDPKNPSKLGSCSGFDSRRLHRTQSEIPRISKTNAFGDVSKFSGFPVLATGREALHGNLHQSHAPAELPGAVEVPPDRGSAARVVDAWDRWLVLRRGPRSKSGLAFKQLREAIDALRDEVAS